MEFKENSFKLIVIRVIFFEFMYLVSIPGMLMKKLESMRMLSFAFLITVILLLLSIVIQLFSFREHY